MTIVSYSLGKIKIRVTLRRDLYGVTTYDGERSTLELYDDKTLAVKRANDLLAGIKVAAKEKGK